MVRSSHDPSFPQRQRRFFPAVLPGKGVEA